MNTAKTKTKPSKTKAQTPTQIEANKQTPQNK